MKPPAKLVLVKGKWYVQITVPQEHRKALRGKRQLRVSTGTGDKKLAESRMHDKAQELYDKLPDPIAQLKDKIEDLSGPVWIPQDLEDALAWQEQKEEMELRQQEIDQLNATIKELKAEESEYSLTIQELADRWLETSPYPSSKTTKEAKTAIRDFVGDNSNLTIGSLTAQTAYEWAEKLAKTKGNKTIRKKVGYVSYALSWGEKKGLVRANPFFGLKLSGYGTKTQSYIPFSVDELRALFDQKMPERHRLLLKILATTGMRLDEAALLNWEDVKKESGVLYFDLTGHDKRIKNIGSARKVPVPKVLLKKITMGKTGQMFPDFKRNADGKAQGPASKALMPYIREVTDNPRKTLHSLRGTLKDKLRDAGVSKETNDFITGHGSGDVSGKYGSGPSLEVRQDALNRVSWPL